MEEPKNLAIKILVDKLKAEQSELISTEHSIKLYETSVKSHRDNKSNRQRVIKELAVALKKLGHKECPSASPTLPSPSPCPRSNSSEKNNGR